MEIGFWSDVRRSCDLKSPNLPGVMAVCGGSIMLWVAAVVRFRFSNIIRSADYLNILYSSNTVYYSIYRLESLWDVLDKNVDSNLIHQSYKMLVKNENTGWK